MEKMWAVFGFIMAATLGVYGNITVAENALYQKQRLERKFRERQYDLKLQQRLQSQPKALQAQKPAQKQRIQQYQYRQQLRQLDLYQRQQRTLLIEQPGVNAEQRNQLLEREQHQQDLDFKLQPKLEEGCCAVDLRFE